MSLCTRVHKPGLGLTLHKAGARPYTDKSISICNVPVASVPCKPDYIGFIPTRKLFRRYASTPPHGMVYSSSHSIFPGGSFPVWKYRLICSTAQGLLASMLCCNEENLNKKSVVYNKLQTSNRQTHTCAHVSPSGRELVVRHLHRTPRTREAPSRETFLDSSEPFLPVSPGRRGHW